MTRAMGNTEHEVNQALFRVVNEIATDLAGRPVPRVFAALRDQVPTAAGLHNGELLQIAQEISIGRNPSGLQ
ncbi:hypothetical protein [Streptosporangium sp. KLBMP 9127]|nr:hypothetical protein [Streptosporangium sp. KLBMP 9127]